MCALFKSYKGGKAWKEIRDRFQAPSYMSRVDHNWKIRARKHRYRKDTKPIRDMLRIETQKEQRSFKKMINGITHQEAFSGL
jgi:hypothetical protein